LCARLTTTKNSLDNVGRVIRSITQTYDDTGPTPTKCMLFDTTIFFYKGVCLSNSYHKKTVPLKIINKQQYGLNTPSITDTIFYEYNTVGNITQMRKGNKDGTITTNYSNYTPTGSYGKKIVSAPGCDSRTETF
jgi:hypothetical protein